MLLACTYLQNMYNLFAKTCINFIFFKSIWFQVPTKFISKIIITLSLTLVLYCSFLGKMHAWCFPLKVFEETKHYDLLSFIYLYIYIYIYFFFLYLLSHGKCILSPKQVFYFRNYSNVQIPTSFWFLDI